MTTDVRSASELNPSQLSVLLTDYASMREDQRTYVTSQISVITVLLTTLTVLGGLVFTIHRNVTIPGPILAFAPTIVFVPLLLLHNMGADAVYRSFYMRALERSLREHLHMSHCHYAWPNLPPLSYSELSLVIQSLNPQPGTTKPHWTRLHGFIFSVVPIAVVVLGGLTGYIALQVSAAWRSLMLIGYGGGAIALIASTAHFTIKSRKLFGEAIVLLNERLKNPLDSSREGTKQALSGNRLSNPLMPYLILPRPDDLVKGLFLVMGVILAQFSKPEVTVPSAADALSLGVLWFTTEILIYQARYQWNDILGRKEDQGAQGSESSNRLPSAHNSVGAAWVSIVIRIYLALVITHFNWHVGNWGIRLLPATYWALMLYLALAVIYELIRAWIRRSGFCGPVGRSLLLTIVGLGYPARFLIGWLATGTGLSLPLACQLAGLWALGVSFVGATWVLSGASYFVFQRGRAVSRIGAKNIDAKPHLYAMLQLVAGPLPNSSDASSTDSMKAQTVAGGDFQFLKDSSVVPCFSPWQFGSAVWLLFVGGGGGYIVGLAPARVSWILTVAILGAVALLIPTPNRLAVRTQLLAPILLLVAYGLEFLRAPWVFGYVTQAGFRIFALILLVLLAAVTYMSFRYASYQGTRNVVKNTIAFMGRFWITRVVPFACGDIGPFRGSNRKMTS